MLTPFSSCKVLITGHTGFKGAWLSLLLHRLGAQVYGYSLPAPTAPSLYEVIHEGTFVEEECADIRVLGALFNFVEKVQPDVVFHLAGQAIVSECYELPAEAFGVNTLGTVCLLEAIRRAKLDPAIVVATTDKVYDATYQDCTESTEFAYDHPYQASKVGAELAVRAYRHTYGMRIATARAGNVIGGGDYAKNRLIPDCVRAWMAGKEVDIRNLSHVRPWQYVLDCVYGYALLAGALDIYRELAEPFNFGPDTTASVWTVADMFASMLPSNMGGLALQKNPAIGPEDHSLTLNSNKAKRVLGWKPLYDLKETLKETAEFYVQRHRQPEGVGMRAFCLGQVDRYLERARAAMVKKQEVSA